MRVLVSSLIFCCAIFYGLLLSTESLAANNPNSPRVLFSDPTRLVIEITVPPYRLSENAVQGSAIDLPGYFQIADYGKPALPFLALPIAVPTGARPLLHVLEINSVQEEIADVAPAPTPIRSENPAAENTPADAEQYDYARDPLVYQRDAFWPESQVVLGGQNIMRGVTIQSVLFYPIQYNPVQGRVNRVIKITLEVRYNTSASVAGITSARPISPAFEKIFTQTLLNSEMAQQWPASPRLQKTNADYFLGEGEEWYKIQTPNAGLYHLTATDLAEKGLDITTVDPRRLRMFNQGREIAIRINGEADGRFDTDDSIEFYATAFKNYYTTTNVYWLTLGETPGKRMAQRDGAPIGSSAPLTTGRQSLHYEIDTIRETQFEGPENKERWFMSRRNYVGAPVVEGYDINLPAAVQTGAVPKLVLRQQGLTGLLNISPDHRTQVTLNGNAIYDQRWDGQVALFDSTTFDETFLRAGANRLEIVSPGGTEAFIDFQLSDFFELHYTADNRALDDTLLFSVKPTGATDIRASGFAGATEIYDITEPENPAWIFNAAQAGEAITFSHPDDRERSYYLFSPTKKHAPLVEKAQSANLRSTALQADYLFITCKEFIPALQPLVDYRELEGHSTKIIDVQDIYDEFNYGFYHDRAIRNFLAYVYNNWRQPAPAFVLLVGDASWNPRQLPGDNNAYGADRSDFVPTHLFEADDKHLEAASDNWLACVDGEDDVLPDYLVGRLPARSTAEVEQMVAKIVGYATDYTPGAWQQKAAFVADIGEGGLLAFEQISDSLISNFIPENFASQRLYLADLGMPQTRDEIVNTFSTGALTMNYFGHGSVSLWSAKSILAAADVAAMSTHKNLPFVFTMSCINGYFIEPRVEDWSLAEALLNNDGQGAVAVFSGSGKALASVLRPLAETLYGTLYHDKNPLVGMFTGAGLVTMNAAYPNQPEHVRFYILFGDPATALHYDQAITPPLYAGFRGKVIYDNKIPPAGSTLQAFINKNLLAQSGLNNGDGSFGPLGIPPDDPITPEIDGGAAGDSVLFRLVLPDSAAATLAPAALWLQGQIQEIELTAQSTGVTSADLDVAFFVDERRVGRDFFSGDPIAASSIIFVEITGAQNATDIELSLNQTKLAQHEYTTVQLPSPANQKMILAFQPGNLTSGDYELTLSDLRASTEMVLRQQAFQFTLQSALAFGDVVNYPNPFDRATTFTYMLFNDTPSLVKIKIFTVAGRLVNTIDNAPGEVGYNKVEWNGLDASGDVLANGLYLYKIIANDGEEQAEIIGRLVVMH